MLSLIGRATALFEKIPGDLIAIIARIGIATTFLRSGLLKLDGWSDTPRDDARDRDFRLSQRFRHPWPVGSGAALSDKVWA